MHGRVWWCGWVWWVDLFLWRFAGCFGESEGRGMRMGRRRGLGYSRGHLRFDTACEEMRVVHVLTLEIGDVFVRSNNAVLDQTEILKII